MLALAAWHLPLLASMSATIGSIALETGVGCNTRIGSEEPEVRRERATLSCRRRAQPYISWELPMLYLEVGVATDPIPHTRLAEAVDGRRHVITPRPSVCRTATIPADSHGDSNMGGSRRSAASDWAESAQVANAYERR